LPIELCLKTALSVFERSMWLYSSTWSLAVLGVRYSIAGQGEAIAPVLATENSSCFGRFSFLLSVGTGRLTKWPGNPALTCDLERIASYTRVGSITIREGSRLKSQERAASAFTTFEEQRRCLPKHRESERFQPMQINCSSVQMRKDTGAINDT